MHKLRFLPILLLLGFSLNVAAQKNGRLPILVGKNKTFKDNLFAFSQDVVVDGEVDGDLGNISGDIHIKGIVKGNVSALVGSIIVYRTAQIEGNIVCFGGDLTIHPEAKLPGKVLHFFGPKSKQAETRIGHWKTKVSLFFLVVALLFAVLLGIYYFFPNQVNEASFELSQEVVQAIIGGAWTLTAFFFALFFSFLLMVVAIGIPMFVVVAAALMAVLLFGGNIILYRFASSLTEHWSGINLVFAMLLVCLAAALLIFLPLTRPFFLAVLAVMGSGIVIITRFGTNKSWFTKKSKFWAAG